jgi:nucleotide-binding universal stress UspA family protein
MEVIGMRIVIGSDGSETSRIAIELVASRSWPFGTRVDVVGAVEPLVEWSRRPRRTGTATPEGTALATVLEDQADPLRRVGLAVDARVEAGPAIDVITCAARESMADLIVVGSRRLGPASSAILGSVSAHLVDHAACPVLVARAPALTRMVLATDGTPSSRDLPRVLAAWGPAFRGLPVEVVTVTARGSSLSRPADDSLTLGAWIAEQVADELMELGWHSAATTRTGDPVHEIVEEQKAWRADLIVTGSRGIGTLHRLVAGSVAHDVLMHARSSVLVVRGHVQAWIGSERAVAPA